jgi:hypothetical protein
MRKRSDLKHLAELALIRAERESSEIIFDPRFQNQAIRNRVRELFEGDDEVHWYLRLYHPDSIITGENCDTMGYAE